MFARLLTIAALLGFGAVPVPAQSLADVARQEGARRKEISEPAKVLTNKDLPSVPAPDVAPPEKDAAETSSEPAAADTSASKDDAAGSPARRALSAKEASSNEAPKDQAYWSGRLKELQTGLDRDSGYAEALQSRINALTADFSARDDPAQRSVIGRDRQKALDELERLKKAMSDDKTAIADFLEEARRAAVPPGWLR